MSASKALHPQSDALLACVDGKLEASQIKTIEALLKQDAEARAFVAELKASELPYAAAFEALLTRVDAQAARKQIKHDMGLAQGTKWYSIFSPRPYHLAASLALGLFAGWLLGAGYFIKDAEDRSSWMVQVAEYQQLYVRETLQTAPLELPKIKQLQARLSDALGAELTIPDLSKHQLDFIRGQILEVNGQPLIQLVYQPKTGKPIAFCITTQQFPESDLALGSARGLAMVHWNNQKNSFVLMGEHPKSALIKMAISAQAQVRI